MPGTGTPAPGGWSGRLFAGDRVRFVRPYRDNHDYFPAYVPNGTVGEVVAVDPDRGQVVVRVDNGRTVTIQPAVHEDAQPLRLGYASHALNLQGCQAAVVLVLPGGRQTSSQSAYSMATRCVDELHVFVDAQTQQTGPYRDGDPVQVLSERWAKDARKRAATSRLELDRSPRRSSVDDDLIAAPPSPHELDMIGRTYEPPLVRDLLEGLSIDP
jgi:hypothetical protein